MKPGLLVEAFSKGSRDIKPSSHAHLLPPLRTNAGSVPSARRRANFGKTSFRLGLRRFHMPGPSDASICLKATLAAASATLPTPPAALVGTAWSVWSASSTGGRLHTSQRCRRQPEIAGDWRRDQNDAIDFEPSMRFD